MSVTSVRLDDEVERSLDAAAKDMQRSKGWIVNEALRSYLHQRELEKQRWHDTVEALEDIRMGRVIDGDKVHAWLQSWGSDQELDAPST